MNEIPSEMLRGHIDTIILLCLTESDMHTNQIKEEIEKRAGGGFQLKQGTFYSALQRIVKQGYVKEYRTSNTEDGVRRKFFQLTEKGKNYIDENKDKWTYSREMINVLIETPKSHNAQSKPQEVVQENVITTIVHQEDESSPEDVLNEFLNSQMVNEIPEEKSKNIEIVNEPEPIKEVKKPTKTSVRQDNYDLFKYIDLTQSEIFEDTTSQAQPIKTQEEQKKVVAEPTPVIETNPAKIEEALELVVEKVVEKVLEATVEQKEEPVAEAKTEAPAIDEQTALSKPVQTNEAIAFVEEIPAKAVEKEIAPTASIQANIEKIAPENDDFYNGEQPISQDYKTVLSKIFDEDKPKKEQVTEIIYTQGLDVNRFFGEQNPIEREMAQAYNPPPPKKEKIKQTKQKPIKQREEKEEPVKKTEVVKHPYYDFSDIQSMADREGFRIKVSSSDRKQDGGRILINKLLFHSAFTFFAIILVETLLVYFATKDIAQLSFMPFGIFLGVMALMPIYTAILYIFNRDKKVNKVSSFKSAIELLAIIILNLILIEIVCCVLANLDFSNQMHVMRYVVYPIFFIINLPIYLFIKYLKLDKNNYYM